MKKTTKVLLICGILTISTVFLQGCANPDSKTEPQSPDKIPEICSSLNNELITSLLETKSYEVNILDELNNGAEGCKYIDTSVKTDTAKTLNFIIRKSELTQQTKNSYYSAINVWQNSNLENREFSHQDNIGDEAFFAYSPKTPQLVTYKNSTLLIITFGNMEQDSESILKKAAAVAKVIYQQ